MTRLSDLSQELDEAARTGIAIPQLSTRHGMALDEAYALQRAVVDRRVARGERRVGVKLGFTSRAKAAQMGVDDVIIGELTSGMLIPDGGKLNLRHLIHPRIEPEVAFRLGRTIHPDAPLEHAVTAVTAVAPALEIIDSRYHNFRFSLIDVVADNTSAAGVVLGTWRPMEPGIENRGVLLDVDGHITTGSTAAILGDPLRALTATARLAAARNLALPAGTVILAGAVTEAVALTAGVAVEARIAGLGCVTLKTERATIHD
ncbi:fumarylacetoacetate hydrolase family protein [Streptomyces sp. ME01-18a]|uniref:2-keto-4-pentenoate hydratase n=1 Tax=Streptomyces sp. ME01-18a TaxID=3028669 RepID=UPI0029AEA891|nr:fumarylacetoacetate hydrolase family protein [Streptomyces sp. ME01-18a]MDX3434371.1 fumarylacetoacetate hydrolase family protein [Streptomyces sp. ME01-18a]